MKPQSTISKDGVEQLPLSDFTERAYLDYSMYVILDRALPHISDGLKPVQRRIVYAMSELGLKNTAKYKKSARTVGDVLGKYHPHGDSACYEAMVLMAQPFSYRYALIDGQGNWGSLDDPKSFAAMRYTESRLTAYAQSLLAELGQGTADWVPNFDGTLKEPERLPARLPNVLLNGCSGIAVGMATDIPPHNLREVVSACIRLLEEPKTTLSGLCEHIQGPDFPTKAEIITPRADLMQLYTKGTGSIRMRALYEEEGDEIVVTALPHQSSGAKILEQIAGQMRAKKLPMVADLRDESDHENPTRLLITPRSRRVNADELMLHLFATTDLEKTYRVNFNMIGLDGRPQVKDLLTILKEWLEYRATTVRRRLQFRLDKVVARLHLLDGLLVAYLNIDEVIAIIRREDKPKPVLMKQFKLTDQQAEAILELKLRHLAKLEEMKIRAEQDALNKERESLEKTLNSKQRLKTLIRKELMADADQYGDDRCSPIVTRQEATAIREDQIVPAEPITVILSQKGWVRAAKGHEIDTGKLNFKSGDAFLACAMGKSNQMAVFMDSQGRSYAVLAQSLPSARGLGDPLTSRLKPQPGSSFVGVIMGDLKQHWLLASDAGYGFVTTLEELITKSRNGKAMLKIPTGARVLSPKPVENYDSQFIAAVTNEGRMLLFPIADLPILPKGKGNKIINIPTASLKAREEYIIDMAVLHENSTLTVHAGKRHFTLKPADLAHYQGERGRRGNKLPRGLRHVTHLEVEK